MPTLQSHQDSHKEENMNIEKSALTTAVLGTLILGTGVTQAAQVAAFAAVSDSSSNFTVLGINGDMYMGANDVVFNWGGSIFTATSDYTGPGSVSNATITSATPFFGYQWTAHDIQVFGPGTYTFDSALGGGNPESGITAMNVGSDQIGMHLLWDWNGNVNMDIALVLKMNAIFGSGKAFFANPADCGTPGNPLPGANCLWDGAGFGPAGAPSVNQTWMYASLDANGDGIPGIPTAVGGPTAGINYNFNFAPVPVPATFWLFGSGLMGLFGIARKRIKSK
jgi:hypothetical protein